MFHPLITTFDPLNLPFHCTVALNVTSLSFSQFPHVLLPPAGTCSQSFQPHCPQLLNTTAHPEPMARPNHPFLLGLLSSEGSTEVCLIGIITNLWSINFF